ncbi:MAG: hypothetical protein GY868_20090 [Deltaproteobacteria bacterium]|nr:hypothetical protein [Deltaproteobacteria bacterium]
MNVFTVFGMLIRSLLLTAVLFVAGGGQALSQDVSLNVFDGQGVARIDEGDIALARHAALADAQSKVIMAAVLDQLSVDDFSKYYLTLKHVFFDHPTIYLQSFKLLSENALLDMYRIRIQGAVQQRLLRHDLESMGVVGPEREGMKTLVMLSEKGPGEVMPSFWWAADKNIAAVSYSGQQALETFFSAKGFSIVMPGTIPEQQYAVQIGHAAEPELENITQIAGQYGARIVVQGALELKPVKADQLSSLVTMQCDIQARVLDVQNKTVIVQAATHELGTHIDEASAAESAVETACRNIGERLAGKIYLQIQDLQELVLKVHFARQVTDAEVHSWIEKGVENLENVEIVQANVSGDDLRTWLITLRTDLEGAAVLQAIFEQGDGIYTAEVKSVENNMVELSVVPVVPEVP